MYRNSTCMYKKARQLKLREKPQGEGATNERTGRRRVPQVCAARDPQKHTRTHGGGGRELQAHRVRSEMVLSLQVGTRRARLMNIRTKAGYDGAADARVSHPKCLQINQSII